MTSLLLFTIVIVFYSKAADVSLLASWYSDHGKYEKPVVVIIEDMERCSGAILSDFINMLRYCRTLSAHSYLLSSIIKARVATELLQDGVFYKFNCRKGSYLPLYFQIFFILILRFTIIHILTAMLWTKYTPYRLIH